MSSTQSRFSPEVPHRPAAERQSPPEKRLGHARRGLYLKWLRRIHSWVGLWGALLGLLFGISGFMLNHRAAPLKIATGEVQVSALQLATRGKRFADPREMTRWVGQELGIDGRLGRIVREAAHPVAWGERRAVQPEHWEAALNTPHESVRIEYWVGNDYVSLKRSHADFLSWLKNLHRGVGLGVAWILLVDTLAGSLLLLSITGVLLWIGMNKRRMVGSTILAAAVIATLVCATS